jgi:hypothetical protein
MQNLISIPIKDETIRKFFLKEFCVNGVYKISGRDEAGKILLLLLATVPAGVNPVKSPVPCHVLVDLGNSNNRRHRYWMDRNNEKYFEAYLKKLLERRFEIFMDMWVMFRQQIQDGIYTFFEDYGIDPKDGEFERWKKHYYRYRKNKETKET